MNRLVVPGYSQNCKATRVTLRFDDKGNLRNPRDAAKSSMVGWGEWQSSEKVPSHFGACWWVSTAGHGGYILVTSVKGLPFKEPALKVEHQFGTAYVYEFEEDCDWAILEYHDELVRRHAIETRNKWRTERGEPAVTEEQHVQENILPVLRRYNAWTLQEAEKNSSVA